MSVRRVSINFSTDEWIEIAEALGTKAHRIEKGDYGPEEKDGEDKRCVFDLLRIKSRIEFKLYGKK